jgi:hypothetical protein
VRPAKVCRPNLVHTPSQSEMGPPDRTSIGRSRVDANTGLALLDRFAGGPSVGRRRLRCAFSSAFDSALGGYRLPPV